MDSTFDIRSFTRLLASCILAAALLSGCGGPPATSGYGVAWVLVTSEPSDYSSYMVTVDSIILTRSDGVEITAVGTPEVVDLATLGAYHEMWASAPIPIGTYVSATVTLDYTDAIISLPLEGHPVQAGVITPSNGSGVTTVSLTTRFDPSNPLIIEPTYASTHAELLSINFNLPASGYYSTNSKGAIAVVRPFITVARSPSDTRPIRVRGPLINSSQDPTVLSYSVYVRPFYDEANNIGTLSMFTQPTTIWLINGKTYLGAAGLSELSTLSAGITMTAAFTQFEFTTNPYTPEVTYAGKFNLLYVIAGSSLEDEYTEGLSGTVVARDGDTLTLQGSTLFLNTADTFSYEIPDTQVILGPGTIVTADNTLQGGFNSDSISVGQHITARGIYNLTSSGGIYLDSTGTSATNTGSVRLQQTPVYGSLTSTASDSLVMNATNIDGWPSSVFQFSGVDPSALVVDTTGITLPTDLAAGGSVFVSGLVNPVGSISPYFTASAVNSESSVQLAGIQAGGAPAVQPGPGGPQCGSGSQICSQASLRVTWNTDPGTTHPFTEPTTAGFFIDVSNVYFASGEIRIGPETIDLKSLPPNLRVVPTTSPVTETFSPLYAVGDPVTASATTTTTPSVTSTQTSQLYAYSSFAAFVTEMERQFATVLPARQLEARGYFDRTANVFFATTVNMVL